MSDYNLPSISSGGISNLHLSSVQGAVGLSVMKEAMEITEIETSMLNEMMLKMQMNSVNPSVGGNINIKF